MFLNESSLKGLYLLLKLSNLLNKVKSAYNNNNTQKKKIEKLKYFFNKKV